MIAFQEIVDAELLAHDIRLCTGCDSGRSHNRGFVAHGPERVIHYSKKCATRATLYGFLHEVGHVVFCHHINATKLRRFERESQAEEYARLSFKALGLVTPRSSVAKGNAYVARMKRFGDNVRRGLKCAKLTRSWVGEEYVNAGPTALPLFKVQWRAPGQEWRERNNPPRVMPFDQAVDEAREVFDKNKGAFVNNHEVRVIAEEGEDEPLHVLRCSQCRRWLETRSSVLPDFCGTPCEAPDDVDPALAELFERATIGMNSMPNALYQEAVKQVIAIAKAAKGVR